MTHCPVASHTCLVREADWLAQPQNDLRLAQQLARYPGAALFMSERVRPGPREGVKIPPKPPWFARELFAHCFDESLKLKNNRSYSQLQ